MLHANGEQLIGQSFLSGRNARISEFCRYFTNFIWRSARGYQRMNFSDPDEWRKKKMRKILPPVEKSSCLEETENIPASSEIGELTCFADIKFMTMNQRAEEYDFWKLTVDERVQRGTKNKLLRVIPSSDRTTASLANCYQASLSTATMRRELTTGCVWLFFWNSCLFTGEDM